MLNPSTADATRDDPTIRRCIRFAKSWGHGSLAVVNLFAYRTSSPKCFLQESDPVGPDNDVQIQAAAHQADCVVCAWGSYVGKSEDLRARAAFVRRMLLGNLPVHCLGVTQDGHPRHPLYVRKEVEHIQFGEVPGEQHS